MQVAIVCLGNICRSPMAESVARAMVEQAGLAELVSVESFGTGNYHVGGSADHRASAALAQRGWANGGHRARQITAADIERLDLVLAADRANLHDLKSLADDPAQRDKIVLLRSFDPASVHGDDEVPDPWFGGADGFDHVLDLIEAACRGLVEHLATKVR